MELSASAHFEDVGRVGQLHAQAHVRPQLTGKPFTEVARGDEFSFLAGKGGVVHYEIH